MRRCKWLEGLFENVVDTYIADGAVRALRRSLRAASRTLEAPTRKGIEHQFRVITRSLVAVICAFLLSISPAVTSDDSAGRNESFVDALWVGQTDRLTKYASREGSILLDVVTGYRAVAVDRVRGRLWALGHGSLEGLGLNGEPIASVTLGGGNSVHMDLSVDPGDGGIWAGIHKALYHLDEQGNIISQGRLSHQTVNVAFDEVFNQVWAATRKTVEVVNAVGDPLFDLNLGKAVEVQALALAPDTGEAWVALDAARDQSSVRKYHPNGAVLLDIALEGVKHLAADSQGGLWAATDKTLFRIDAASGLVLFSMAPFSGQGVIDAITVDPRDGSVWIGGNQQVRQVDHQSLVKQTIPISRKIRDLAAYADTTPPTIEFTAPENQALLNDAQPDLALTFQDDAIGVDTETLSLLLDEDPLETSCSFEESVAECASNNPLPEGLNTIKATVSDYAGNESEPAELELTIDTIPPEITVFSPADQGFVNQRQSELLGGLSESADLTINGQPVATDLQFQFAHPVSFVEGANVFELVAMDQAGNGGTLTHSVILDTIPPAIPNLDLITVEDLGDGEFEVAGEAGSVEPSSSVSITNDRTGATVTTQADEQGTFMASIEGGAGDTFTVLVRDPAENESDAVEVGAGGSVPPDPEDVAPELVEIASGK